MRGILASMGVAVTLAFSAPAAAAPVNLASITPAFEYDLAFPETYTEPMAEPLPPTTLGYSFTLSLPGTVNALGYWSDGNLVSEQVGIWDAMGTLVASAFVTPVNEVGGYYYSLLATPVSLADGTYSIGGSISEGGLFPFNMTGVNPLAPGYTYLGSLEGDGSGFARPTSFNPAMGNTYGDQGIALVNFSFSAISAVPEPSTWAMMLLGFGAVGVTIRRRRKTLSLAHTA